MEKIQGTEMNNEFLTIEHLNKALQVLKGNNAFPQPPFAIGVKVSETEIVCGGSLLRIEAEDVDEDGHVYYKCLLAGIPFPLRIYVSDYLK